MKLQKESQVYKLRNVERSVSEELSTIKTEITFIQEQLEELKDTLTQINHQINMIDICKASEITKIQMQKDNLEEHKKGFQCLFDKERRLSEVHNKELQERDAVELETRKQKEEQITEKNEQQAREAAALEKECEAFDRECSVLKKRNTAIMLKLRRKLVETENMRRDLMKKKDVAVCNSMDAVE
ncbi:uncharacterized protein LOC128677767 isoform X2 [Plodia interpunctella]|nr:uncharacterized protein LOC128677767 isoform X2 [Plodia interpunctella]